MYSSNEQLKRRTPKDGIDRREYISLLVDEYYETNNLEAQQQVTANLANFAYDPINWNFLKQAKAHELFVEILQFSADRALLTHSAAGLCNICLDEQISEYIVCGGVLKQLQEVAVKHQDKDELLGHVLTILIYVNRQPVSKDFKELIDSLQQHQNKKIANLATVLLEDAAAARKVVQQ